MNRHFIFDFETFGQDTSKCAVINCALCVFDWDRITSDNPYTFQELVDEHIVLKKLDVEHQVKNLGFQIEQSTVEFWNSLPNEVKAQIKPKPNDLKLDDFCDQVLDFLGNGKINFWWSRGNTFDPIILMRLFDTVGKKHEIENILKFWLVRDTRTYIDALTGFGLKKNAFNPLNENEQHLFKEHNAIHDVAVDVLRLQYLEQN